MEMNHTSNRIHPLMAGAAISVTLVSLLGIAAISGVLPNSHAKNAEIPPVAALATTTQPLPASTQQVPKHTSAAQNHTTQHTQAQSNQQTPQIATHQQPAPVAKNSPIGIGIGAVVGGLLGNQVGDGNGKTLATIAGAVGGGYVGNEIAKHNP